MNIADQIRAALEPTLSLHFATKEHRDNALFRIVEVIVQERVKERLADRFALDDVAESRPNDKTVVYLDFR